MAKRIIVQGDEERAAIWVGLAQRNFMERLKRRRELTGNNTAAFTHWTDDGIKIRCVLHYDMEIIHVSVPELIAKEHLQSPSDVLIWYGASNRDKWNFETLANAHAWWGAPVHASVPLESLLFDGELPYMVVIPGLNRHLADDEMDALAAYVSTGAGRVLLMCDAIQGASTEQVEADRDMYNNVLSAIGTPMQVYTWVAPDGSNYIEHDFPVGINNYLYSLPASAQFWVSASDNLEPVLADPTGYGLYYDRLFSLSYAYSNTRTTRYIDVNGVTLDATPWMGEWVRYWLDQNPDNYDIIFEGSWVYGDDGLLPPFVGAADAWNELSAGEVSSWLSSCRDFWPILQGQAEDYPGRYESFQSLMAYDPQTRVIVSCLSPLWMTDKADENCPHVALELLTLQLSGVKTRFSGHRYFNSSPPVRVVARKKNSGGIFDPIIVGEGPMEL